MTVEKGYFRFIRKWTVEECARPDGPTHKVLCAEYEASFWEAPVEPGEVGYYYKRRCVARWKGRRWSNACPSVSYYSKLCKAAGVTAPVNTPKHTV
jgi:hypothetical protein